MNVIRHKKQLLIQDENNLDDTIEIRLDIKLKNNSAVTHTLNLSATHGR